VTYISDLFEVADLFQKSSKIDKPFADLMLTRPSPPGVPSQYYCDSRRDDLEMLAKREALQKGTPGYVRVPWSTVSGFAAPVAQPSPSPSAPQVAPPAPPMAAPAAAPAPSEEPTLGGFLLWMLH
jgi:hypothetical protein